MTDAYRRLYDKVLRDETFREFLDADPRAALESIEINPTPEIMKGVENTLKAIREMQRDFGIEDVEKEICIT
ncbi:hypothetical protein [Silvibacterium acidisoli]|uniref:hypothetical protein n=1 Tax=Acidobacteriaceae bacterium ZG23-2 TaxID=2883246 RepID=UPI00406D2599